MTLSIETISDEFSKVSTKPLLLMNFVSGRSLYGMALSEGLNNSSNIRCDIERTAAVIKLLPISIVVYIITKVAVVYVGGVLRYRLYDTHRETITKEQIDAIMKKERNGCSFL